MVGSLSNHKFWGSADSHNYVKILPNKRIRGILHGNATLFDGKTSSSGVVVKPNRNDSIQLCYEIERPFYLIIEK